MQPGSEPPESVRDAAFVFADADGLVEDIEQWTAEEYVDSVAYAAMTSFAESITEEDLGDEEYCARVWADCRQFEERVAVAVEASRRKQERLNALRRNPHWQAPPNLRWLASRGHATLRPRPRECGRPRARAPLRAKRAARAGPDDDGDPEPGPDSGRTLKGRPRGAAA
jgi:hypothetical protein